MPRSLYLYKLQKFVRIHAHTHTNTHTHTHTHTQHTHSYIHTHMTYMYTYTGECIHTHKFTHTYMYPRIHPQALIQLEYRLNSALLSFSHLVAGSHFLARKQFWGTYFRKSRFFYNMLQGWLKIPSHARRLWRRSSKKILRARVCACVSACVRACVHITRVFMTYGKRGEGCL